MEGKAVVVVGETIPREVEEVQPNVALELQATP